MLRREEIMNDIRYAEKTVDCNLMRIAFASEEQPSPEEWLHEVLNSDLSIRKKIALITVLMGGRWAVYSTGYCFYSGDPDIQLYMDVKKNLNKGRKIYVNLGLLPLAYTLSFERKKTA